MKPALQVLRLEFAGGEVNVRVQYVAAEQDAPNPSTKRRRSEVLSLARQGLEEALLALSHEGDTHVVGESGFTRRTDTLNASIPGKAKEAAG